jgi:N-acetyl-alpha-D-muramate 1-phosphate uridylyltransferase
MRLGELTRGVPKPMVLVAGRPFLDHQLLLLRRHGVRRVVLAVGYLGGVIERHVGDGSAFDLEVNYSHDASEQAGTAGALRRALPLLGESFLALYGDTYLRIAYADVDRAHRESGLPALMTVLRNDDSLQPSNAVFEAGRVVAYNKESPPSDARWIDYGLLGLTPEALEADPSDELAEVQRALAAAGQLAGYEATERFYDIGTPGALAETEAFLAQPTG